VHVPHPSSLYGAGAQSKAASQAKAQPVAPVATPQPETINKLIAKRKPKDFRRRQSGPFNPSNVPSAAIPSASTSSVQMIQPPPPPPMLPNGSVISESDSFGFDEISGTSTPLASSISHAGRHRSAQGQNLFHGDPFRSMSSDILDSTMEVDSKDYVNIAALDTQGGRVKRKGDIADILDDGASVGGRPTKPRTLGGDRPREAVRPKQLVMTQPMSMGSSAVEAAAPGLPLQVPPLLTFLTMGVKVSGSGSSETVFEGRNPEEGGKLIAIVLYWVISVIEIYGRA
jgi:protein HIRA/HIR1